MTWDDECEARTWELMRGFVDDKGKPTRREQERDAKWLNQILPYPGWRFRLSSSGKYWVVSSAAMGVISGGLILGGLLVGGKYTHGMSAKSSDTLIELITQLEMGL